MTAITNFVEVVETLEETNKLAERMKILGYADDAAKTLIHEALSPYRVFGVKKYDKPTEYGTAPYKVIGDVVNVLDELATRELSGNAAREAVTDMLSWFPERESKVLARVIGKDLKCGCGDTIINKVFPGLVPVFDVMLAEKVDKKFKWKFPVIADAKLDGQRVIAMCEDGIVNYFSRAGKPSDFCNGLFDDELVAIEKHLGYPVVLDGEVMADSYIQTMNAKKSGDGGKTGKDNLRLNAFDYCSLAAWTNGTFVVNNTDRINSLDSILSDLKLSKIVPVLRKTCNDMDELREFYRYVLDLGYEGLILKDPFAMYEKKRSKAWTKWKPTYQADLKIVGLYEGREGTKNVGKLGGFNLEGEDENGNRIVTNCGSIQVGKNEVLRQWIIEKAEELGVPLGNQNAVVSTEEESDDGNDVSAVMNTDQFFRWYVWTHQDEFIGKTAQIEYQELSKAENSDTFSLRFPTFQFVRDDK